VSKKETDILLIRKYLNGELDARAMHELERRSLDDPFLMEAMQGYEQTEGDQKSNRETKKPKKEKIKTIAAAPSLKSGSGQVSFSPGKKK